MYLRSFAFLFTCILGASAQAQVDTLGKGNTQLHMNQLKPGVRQYLVCFQNPKVEDRLGFWFWQRDVKLTTQNGEKVVSTSQHWYGSDTSNFRSVYSINKASDFSPLYHAEKVTGKTRAYKWSAAKIVGDDTVENNVPKDFKLDFAKPTFNWNLDIETFEMLPLAAGKTFAINFYDAGQNPPAYSIYKVAGSEVINTYDGHQVDCWILRHEGSDKGNTYSQSFWISKKGHEFLKEEDVFNGTYRYKIKMPVTMPDILQSFIK